MTVQRVSKESVEKIRVLSYFLPPEEAHEKKTFDSLLNREAAELKLNEFANNWHQTSLQVEIATLTSQMAA